MFVMAEFNRAVEDGGLFEGKASNQQHPCHERHRLLDRQQVPPVEPARFSRLVGDGHVLLGSMSWERETGCSWWRNSIVRVEDGGVFEGKASNQQFIGSKKPL